MIISKSTPKSEKPNLQIGSTVQLKTGGPIMTVNGFRDFDTNGVKEQFVICVYFDNQLRRFNETFLQADALNLITQSICGDNDKKCGPQDVKKARPEKSCEDENSPF